MNIIISNSSNQPIYEQIADQFKSLIINGTLKPGEPLPSMRTLAKDLHISVITTKRTYEILEQDGFIESYVGKGSYVKCLNKELLKEEYLRQIEEHLMNAIKLANIAKLETDELIELIKVLKETQEYE